LNVSRACPPSAAPGSRLFKDGSAEGRWIVADRGYTSHRFREHICDLGARPAIPPLRHEAPVACPGWIYRNRHRVENLWARLKKWRAVATRYEKTERSFLGVLCLAAAIDWLRR
jgi:transposase